MTESKTVQVAEPDEPSEGQLVPVVAGNLLMEVEKSRVWSSFPLTTPADRINAVNVMNGACESISAFDRQTVWVKDLVAHDAEWVDEKTGELITTVRVVMVTREGKLIQSVGMTARQSLSRIMAACPMPWANGLPIFVQKGLSNAKRPVYSLTIDQKALTAQAGATDNKKGK